MADPDPRPLEKTRTRRAVLDLLKQEGSLTARAMATRLGVSAMAIRQHLYELADETLVEYETNPAGRGRPSKHWRLTPAADRFFPDGHADLTTDLIRAMRATFGEDGVDRMLAVRADEQVRDYAAAIGDAPTIRTRLDALAEARTHEGYMAAVQEDADGSYLFVENHCPICVAARACSGLCRAELDVFRRVLGDEVSVDRTDHLLTGARRCAYRVKAKS